MKNVLKLVIRNVSVIEQLYLIFVLGHGESFG